MNSLAVIALAQPRFRTCKQEAGGSDRKMKRGREMVKAHVPSILSLALFIPLVLSLSLPSPLSRLSLSLSLSPSLPSLSPSFSPSLPPFSLSVCAAWRVLGLPGQSSITARMRALLLASLCPKTTWLPTLPCPALHYINTTLQRTKVWNSIQPVGQDRLAH